MVSVTFAQQCYELLKSSILEGRYLPGQKLCVNALSKDFKIGPTPIREALSRLSETGLIDSLENRGFRVAEVTEEKIKDLYHTFAQIEILALEQSLEQGDDLWASSIVAALYALSLVENTKKFTPEIYSQWAERNAHFHSCLISACQSPHLNKIRNGLYIQFDYYLRLAFINHPKEISLNHEEHQNIAKAVLKRDKVVACTLLKKHIFSGMALVIKNNSIYMRKS